jgi:hypothetical protein
VRAHTHTHTHTHKEASVSNEYFYIYSSTLKENKYVLNTLKCNQDLVFNMAEGVYSVKASGGLSAPYLYKNTQLSLQ